jgi:hypothetical protein
MSGDATRVSEHGDAGTDSALFSPRVEKLLTEARALLQSAPTSLEMQIFRVKFVDPLAAAVSDHVLEAARRRELAVLCMAAWNIHFAGCRNPQARISRYVRDYFGRGHGAWYFEREMTSSLDPQHVLAHAILKRTGRPPCSSTIYELLVKYGCISKKSRGPKTKNDRISKHAEVAEEK